VSSKVSWSDFLPIGLVDTDFAHKCGFAPGIVLFLAVRHVESVSLSSEVQNSLIQYSCKVIAGLGSLLFSSHFADGQVSPRRLD
jgi:hypothetical protein